ERAFLQHVRAEILLDEDHRRNPGDGIRADAEGTVEVRIARTLRFLLEPPVASVILAAPHAARYRADGSGTIVRCTVPKSIWDGEIKAAIPKSNVVLAIDSA